MALERVTVGPAQMGGVPCIRGLRVTVSMVLGQLAAGHTVDQLLADYPYLGHAARHVDEIGLLRASDITIFDRAAEGGGVLITADTDFDAPGGQGQRRTVGGVAASCGRAPVARASGTAPRPTFLLSSPLYGTVRWCR